MENLRRRVNYTAGKHCCTFSGIFGQGGSTFLNNRLIILCLGLLNAVLLIAAVVLGVKCTKVKEGSLQVSHSAASQLINELNYLRSNHSDVIEAEEEAKNELERVLKKHARLKLEIEQQKTISDRYLTQIEAIREERKILHTNISDLEGTCGKCLSGWTLRNSSCYFFSYSVSSTVKKNWPDSRADCKSHGADLVVIENKEEQKYVVDIIKSLISGPITWKKGFWMGITDIETEGTWVWINNVTEVEQRYWVDGEPNNHGRQGENCGISISSPTNPWKTWFDADCHLHLLYWICEMPSR